jgi:hypothetical protein
MFNEKFVEALAERSVEVVYLEGGKGCCNIATRDEYVVYLMGWNIQCFYTEVAAIKFKETLKQEIKENIIKVLVDINKAI